MIWPTPMALSRTVPPNVDVAWACQALAVGASESRPQRAVEVQVLIVAAGVLDARVVAPRDGGIALYAAEDPARRGDGRVEVKRRAGPHVDVAVRVHAAVECHVRTGGDLEVHPGAVEDAELEERHLDLAEDLGQAGARAVVAANLRGDEIVGDLSAEARVGPDRESRWIRVRRSRHDPGHRIIDEGELGIAEGGRRDAAELGRRGRRRAGEDGPQRHHARLDPRL